MENRKLYRELRKCGVPFVDAHLVAKKCHKYDYLKAFQFAESKSWAKEGPSDYKYNEYYEEWYSYATLILPNGHYLVLDSDGVYVSDTKPLLF